MDLFRHDPGLKGAVCNPVDQLEGFFQIPAFFCFCDIPLCKPEGAYEPGVSCNQVCLPVVGIIFISCHPTLSRDPEFFFQVLNCPDHTGIICRQQVELKDPVNAAVSRTVYDFPVGVMVFIPDAPEKNISFDVIKFVYDRLLELEIAVLADAADFLII